MMKLETHALKIDACRWTLKKAKISRHCVDIDRDGNDKTLNKYINSHT